MKKNVRCVKKTNNIWFNPIIMYMEMVKTYLVKDVKYVTIMKNHVNMTKLGTGF